MSATPSEPGSILVVDVGTSGVRSAVVRPDATVSAAHHRPVLPVSPAPGLVEFDPGALAQAALGVAREALADVDLVVIPTRPSPHDLRAVAGTVAVPV